MSKTKKEIIDDITNHINDNGGTYYSWYVGITEDAKRRLFEEHNVDEKNDAWIYRTASSSSIAREIETYFVSTLGTDGGSGGGDEDTRIVYSYKKNSHTTP